VAQRDRFQPTAEQVDLAAGVGDALEALFPIARLHSGNCETGAAWRALDALGLFSMARPEDRGGAGLGLVEEALVALELGRRLVSPAVVATLAAHPYLEPRDGVEAEAVACAYRIDSRNILIDEPSARLVLIREADCARLTARPAGTEVLDDVHWTARLVDVGAPVEVLRTLEGLDLTRLRLLDAAVLAGVSQAALEMAVAYAGLRQQFGRPIGSFQAIKHHCADMALSTRCARDLVAFAAVALGEGDDDGILLAESALVVAGSAAIRNAGLNIQIHGGIGFSDEADPHLLVKRAQLYLAAAGGVDAAVERVCTLEGPVSDRPAAAFP
jgi:alkylation response protein AidB-like acyl-CoA dehydrogenase